MAVVDEGADAVPRYVTKTPPRREWDLRTWASQRSEMTVAIEGGNLMRRTILSAGLAIALVASLAGMASAADGNAYGQRIKACTGLSYGQLRKAVRTNTLPAGITLPSTLPADWLKPSLGAKKTWEAIQGMTCVTPPAP